MRKYELKAGELLDGLTHDQIMAETDFSKLTKGQLAHRYEENIELRSKLNDENKALKEVYSSTSKSEKTANNEAKIKALQEKIAALQGVAPVAEEKPAKGKKVKAN